jgi:hypothetical protein
MPRFYSRASYWTKRVRFAVLGAAVQGPEELRRTLRYVRRIYQEYNLSLFKGRLRPPLIEWSTGESELGAYVSASRSLRLSVVLLDQPWGALLEVLKHEMAHQFVLDELGIRDEGPHGPTFQRVCHQRGIDARARGLPRLDGAEVSGETQRLKDRVEKLLALAESDNQFEAEAATMAARRLMLKYNLERVSGEQERYAFLHVGPPTARRPAWQRILASILAEHFFVEVIVVPVFVPEKGRTASVLELCGTADNLALAEYVYAFLERSAHALWKAHKAEQRLRGDAGRRSFLFGVLSGFRDKLESDARRHEQEGLVWVGDPALADFFRRRHPHIRRVGGSGRIDQSTYDAGHQAGQRIVLHRGIRAGSGNPVPPRLRGKVTGPGTG